MATKTYKVVSGDTLSKIASKYNTTVTNLVKLNKLKSANRIAIGQVLIISGKSSTSTSTSTSTTKKSKTPTKATVDVFGLQSDTDRTMFATWDWTRSNTQEYRTVWHYSTGDGVWFIGSDSTGKDKQSVYSAPQNATTVKFKVKPISKTHKVNKKTVNYWTANWSTDKKYNFKDSPPTTPQAPAVTLEKYELTASVDNLDVNANIIEFQIVKNDSSVFKTGKAAIKTRHASFSCKINTGTEYKVRCRAIRDSKYSDWSEYSSNVGTMPSAPSDIITCKAKSDTAVFIQWSSVKLAKTYDIEYTNEQKYFRGSDQTTIINVTDSTYYNIIGLESGKEYFFRVRAVNEKGESSWTSIKSVILGKNPIAPTTWSSTTTVISGEDLILYWVHNTEDGSSQTYAELELTINGTKEVKRIQNTTDEELKDKTSFYKVDTKTFSEGAKIEWRVRTSGITNVYGDWSIKRTVDVFAPATLVLDIKNSNNESIEVLETFPFYISGIAGPSTQNPISYFIDITSNEAYESVDDVGNVKMISKGESIYSKHFDISNSLLIELSAGQVNLENNIDYTLTGVVSMDSGLTADTSLEFSVAWLDKEYEPSAEIAFDSNTLSMHVRPYCETYPMIYYKVIFNSTTNTYSRTDEIINQIEGESVDEAFTINDDIVYSGIDQNANQIYFCIVESEVGTLVDDISLSVYRREFDGTFTELATGINNMNSTFITDPHPSLDYARYRVVAIENSTGAVSYNDIPGYFIGEKSVVIQWNEEWSYFDIDNEDELEEPIWAGSMLKLPYNIDISDNHSGDVSLIKYIGRNHPVSYYGTQVGSTSTWNMVIEKDDKNTLYALRRLAIYMGDVYIREPSGSGYWANISVSFSQTHKELIIPVSLNITRVIGGI